MWSVDNIIIMLKEIQKKNNISGNVDAVKFCTELGVSMNGLVYLFSCLFVAAFKAIREADEEISKLRAENQVLNDILGDRLKNNGRTAQMVKVSAGLPIAKKARKNLTDLSFQMKLGSTDKELMEYFEISKTTLWRWKKELAEIKKSGKGLYF